ncbi:MAG: succinate dehydrogenase cytochrome b subunit [Cytophagaceae bacterium]|nr:succinate dehydrogenase cytochrome b subunit [Cytophagaceae bacterium]
MSWLLRFFSSSIGKKLIMALTGLFLCSFLVVHMIGNTQLFYADQGLAFNKYAVIMTSNPLIEIISIGLYFFILLHTVQGLLLAYKNRQARPVGYAKFNNSSRWQSRNMAILGTIILVFLVVHMSRFWYQYRFDYVPYKKYVENIQTGQMVSTQAMAESYAVKRRIVEDLDETTGHKVTIVRDLYKEVEVAFQNLPLVLLYVLSMVALAYHLVHGFQSGFQTLGLNHPKYNPLVRWVGVGLFAILIPAVFAAMPIYFYVKSLG